MARSAKIIVNSSRSQSYCIPPPPPSFSKSQKTCHRNADIFLSHHHNGKLSFACAVDEEFLEQLNNSTLRENTGCDILKFLQRRCWRFRPSNMWRHVGGWFPRFQRDVDSWHRSCLGVLTTAWDIGLCTHHISGITLLPRHQMADVVLSVAAMII